MEKEKKTRTGREERTGAHGVYPDPGHLNDVRLGPLEVKSDKLIKSIEAGNMVAVVSGNEIMYTFIYNNEYNCFVHPMEAEEGRYRTFPINERNRAMIKNLDSTADALFEIEFRKEMDLIGVMVAAEPGIINYLDMTGQLKGADLDFMDWQESKDLKEV